MQEIWNYRFHVYLKKIHLDHVCDTPLSLEKRFLVKAVRNVTLSNYEITWKDKLASETAINGNGRNKLRHYKLLKHNYSQEMFLNQPLHRSHRSALMKFRCGVAPLRVETGRYENVPFNERYCFNCPTMVEDEFHVLLKCPIYSHIRVELLDVCKHKVSHFN